jgi:hypothetical protein
MAEPLTPAQRKLRSSIASHERWSREPDRAAAMRPALAGFFAKFERQVDPNGELDPETRQKLAEAARLAHMKRAALASSRARAAKKRGA